MIINSNVFFYRYKFVTLCDGNENLVILEDFTKDFCIWMKKIKINDTSLISAIKGITLRIAWINAKYSAYVLLKPITVCNLLHHNTGHPEDVITHTIRGMVFLHYRNMIDPIHQQIWYLCNTR